ncbi:MAG: NfeD family protein [Alloprevotella sp.]|nr:NfeD family protein [Alloprevotella sp.]MBR1652724.1 NfeD family protein [Alloprevotella sp.]
MEPLLLILIIAGIALLLFAIEVFVTPGFGIAGIAATLCVVLADSLVYFYYDNFTATVTLLVSTAAVLLLIWWLSRARTLEKMALKANIDSTNATAAQLSVQPGQEGRALTRLALIGNAVIDGKTVEVKSTGNFIDEGTPIVVTAVQDALILVEPKA